MTFPNKSKSWGRANGFYKTNSGNNVHSGIPPSLQNIFKVPVTGALTYKDTDVLTLQTSSV